jgi:hypothetical protein
MGDDPEAATLKMTLLLPDVESCAGNEGYAGSVLIRRSIVLN